MFQYMARRLIQAIPILIGVSIIVFLIVYAAPGDPTDRFRTPRVPPEQIEALIRSYGLDKPLARAVPRLGHHLLPGLESRKPGATASRTACLCCRRS